MSDGASLGRTDRAFVERGVVRDIVDEAKEQFRQVKESVAEQTKKAAKEARDTLAELQKDVDRILEDVRERKDDG